MPVAPWTQVPRGRPVHCREDERLRTPRHPANEHASDRDTTLAKPSPQRVGPLPLVHRTAAFTCGAHIDEARGVVEHPQTQRAGWCNALFCGLQHYPRPCLATKTLLGLSALPGLASRDLANRCHAA